MKHTQDEWEVLIKEFKNSGFSQKNGADFMRSFYGCCMDCEDIKHYKNVASEA